MFFHEIDLYRMHANHRGLFCVSVARLRPSLANPALDFSIRATSTRRSLIGPFSAGGSPYLGTSKPGQNGAGQQRKEEGRTRWKWRRSERGGKRKSLPFPPLPLPICSPFPQGDFFGPLWNFSSLFSPSSFPRCLRWSARKTQRHSLIKKLSRRRRRRRGKARRKKVVNCRSLPREKEKFHASAPSPRFPTREK